MRIDTKEFAGVSLVFSPNGQHLISSGRGGITIWDVATGKLVKTFLQEMDFSSVEVSKDGKVLAAGGKDCTTYALSIPSGKVLARLKKDKSTTDKWCATNSAVSFSADGNMLAATYLDFTHTGLIRLWKTSDWRLQHTCKLSGHIGFCCLRFSPDGSKVAVSSLSTELDRAVIEIWGVDPFRRLNTIDDTCLREHRCPFAFSSDSHLLAYVSGTAEDPRPSVRDLRTRKIITSGAGAEVVPIIGLIFSNDMKTLVSCGSSYFASEIREWDIATGRRRKASAFQNVSINAITLAPDGKTIAICGLAFKGTQGPIDFERPTGMLEVMNFQ